MKRFLSSLALGVVLFLGSFPVWGAATFSITYRTVFGNKRVSWGTMTCDTSYPTGGYQVTAANVGLKSLSFFQLDGAQFDSVQAGVMVATFSRPTDYVQLWMPKASGTISAPTAYVSVTNIGGLTTAPVYFGNQSPLGVMGVYSTAAVGSNFQATVAAPALTGTAGTLSEVANGTNVAATKLGWFAIGN